jgi:hypothetical protein
VPDLMWSGARVKVRSTRRGACGPSRTRGRRVFGFACPLSVNNR